MAQRWNPWLAMFTALLLLCACATAQGPAGGLIARTALSPTEELIVVRGAGRDIRCLVLLPDGYARGGDYPALVAVHNFGSDPRKFASLIHAERLRAAGIVVLLPQGVIGNWQGPGITLPGVVTAANDIAGLARLVGTVRGLYRLTADDISVTGYSQGATLALELTRRLDAERPGAVRRLFLSAGAARRPLDATLALRGTDLVAYQPGRNGGQNIANALTFEPGQRSVVQAIVEAKGCALKTQAKTERTERRTYGCADGRTVLHIKEASGEHAWPGQDVRRDNWINGHGSRSEIDLTAIILQAIAALPSA